MCLLCREELALLVEELEGIPLARVMAGCKDNTATCLRHGYCYLCGRSGGQADVYHVKAHTLQRAAYYHVDHVAGDTGITPKDDGIAGKVGYSAALNGVGCYNLYDVKRGERLIYLAADGTADT